MKHTKYTSYAVGPPVSSEILVFGYGASRRMSASAISDQNEGLHTSSLFWDDVDLVNAEEWLLQADYATLRSQNKVKAKKRFNRIKSILIRLLPDVDDIEIIHPGAHRKTPEVRFITPYGKVELQSLGIGYKTMIAWMVDLASNLFEYYPNSADPLSEPVVVLIDEIDLHLHPKWQRTIMDYLGKLFKNTQFIVTAHSPLVVQAAPSANVVVLKREGDHSIIDDSFKSVNKWRLDQLLASDLFGLKTLYPPEIENLVLERRKILSKGKLSKKDLNRIKYIEEILDTYPAGESREDIRAMNLLKHAAKSLETRNK